MSSVIRPSGPLPPRVYWTRRLVLLVALVIVASVLWWFVSGIGDAQPTANPGGPTGSTPGVTPPTTAATTTPTNSWLIEETTPAKSPDHTKSAPTTSSTNYGGEDKPPPGSTAPGATTAPPGKTTSATEPPATTTTTPVPSTTCQATDLDLRIDVSDAVAGHTARASFNFRSLDGTACALQVTPNTLVARVTSGDDVVWSSNDCPDALLARQIVVPATGWSAYTFSWDGHRSTEGCAARGSVAKPGGYWIEAALVGGQAHKSYFDLTS